MEELLTTAMAKHQAGELLPAAELYQQVLAREQDNADALHLLGVLRHQQGDHARAVELIEDSSRWQDPFLSEWIEVEQLRFPCASNAKS